MPSFTFSSHPDATVRSERALSDTSHLPVVVKIRTKILFEPKRGICRPLHRMALSNILLSPTRAPDLGDIATYFFFEKDISIRYQNMCCSDVTFNYIFENSSKTMTSLKHIFWYRIEIFFQKKSMWRYLHEQAHMLVKEICC